METPSAFAPKSPTEPIDAMKFKTKFGELYFQTRQMNLRCFPACDIHHFEKTFCGRNVELLVDNTVLQNPSTYICAEFSQFDGARSFSLGEHIPNKREQVMDEARFMMGKLVMRYDSESKFILSPKGRRWPCSFPRDSRLVIVAYMVQNDRVVQVLTTTPFTIRSKRHKYDDVTPKSQPQQASRTGGDDTDSEVSSAHEVDESVLGGTTENMTATSPPTTTGLASPSIVNPQYYMPASIPIQPNLPQPQHLLLPQQQSTVVGGSMFFPPMPQLFPTYFQLVRDTQGGMLLPSPSNTKQVGSVSPFGVTDVVVSESDMVREQQVRQAAYQALRVNDSFGHSRQESPTKTMRFQ